MNSAVDIYRELNRKGVAALTTWRNEAKPHRKQVAAQTARQNERQTCGWNQRPPWDQKPTGDANAGQPGDQKPTGDRTQDQKELALVSIKPVGSPYPTDQRGTYLIQRFVRSSYIDCILNLN